MGRERFYELHHNLHCASSTDTPASSWSMRTGLEPDESTLEVKFSTSSYPEEMN